MQELSSCKDMQELSSCKDMQMIDKVIPICFICFGHMLHVQCFKYAYFPLFCDDRGNGGRGNIIRNCAMKILSKSHIAVLI